MMNSLDVIFFYMVVAVAVGTPVILITAYLERGAKL